MNYFNLAYLARFRGLNSGLPDFSMKGPYKGPYVSASLSLSIVWEGSEIQRPIRDLRVPDGVLPSHSHAVFLHQCLFLTSKSGCRLRGTHLLPPLPTPCALLCLERRHDLPSQAWHGESMFFVIHTYITVVAMVITLNNRIKCILLLFIFVSYIYYFL